MNFNVITQEFYKAINLISEKMWEGWEVVKSHDKVVKTVALAVFATIVLTVSFAKLRSFYQDRKARRLQNASVTDKKTTTTATEVITGKKGASVTEGNPPKTESKPAATTEPKPEEKPFQVLKRKDVDGTEWTYQGHFTLENGLISGKGTVTRPDGFCYEGTVVNNLWDGAGKITIPTKKQVEDSPEVDDKIEIEGTFSAGRLTAGERRHPNQPLITKFECENSSFEISHQGYFSGTGTIKVQGRSEKLGEGIVTASKTGTFKEDVLSGQGIISATYSIKRDEGDVSDETNFQFEGNLEAGVLKSGKFSAEDHTKTFTQGNFVKKEVIDGRIEPFNFLIGGDLLHGHGINQEGDCVYIGIFELNEDQTQSYCKKGYFERYDTHAVKYGEFDSEGGFVGLKVEDALAEWTDVVNGNKVTYSLHGESCDVLIPDPSGKEESIVIRRYFKDQIDENDAIVKKAPLQCNLDGTLQEIAPDHEHYIENGYEFYKTIVQNKRKAILGIQLKFDGVLSSIDDLRLKYSNRPKGHRRIVTSV